MMIIIYPAFRRNYSAGTALLSCVSSLLNQTQTNTVKICEIEWPCQEDQGRVSTDQHGEGARDGCPREDVGGRGVGSGRSL